MCASIVIETHNEVLGGFGQIIRSDLVESYKEKMLWDINEVDVG